MIKAVIFDWAGTVVDYGSCAPMQAFVSLFERFGLKITIEDARGPMGLNKWDHINALLHLPDVSRQFQSSHGRHHLSSDVDEMLQTFIPMNRQSIYECSELIPGAARVSANLRSQGVLIGSTTGYTRDLLDELIGLARVQDYWVDASVCAGETPRGRPSPDMMKHCVQLLDVDEPSLVIKVDDTVPGLLEGKHYGCWTVGVTASGNAVGLSQNDFESLPLAERAERVSRAEAELAAANPDFLIQSVDDLMPVVVEINARLRQGQRPENPSPFNG